MSAMKTKPIRVDGTLHDDLLRISSDTRPRIGIQALADEAIRRLIEDVNAHGLNVLRETSVDGETKIEHAGETRYRITRKKETGK